MTKEQRLEAEVFLCVKSWVMKTYNVCVKKSISLEARSVVMKA